MELLRQNLHLAIEAERSEQILLQIQEILNAGADMDSNNFVPAGVEERIATGLAQAARGEVYSQAEFDALSSAAAERRQLAFK